MAKARKITISLPPSVCSDLDSVSARLGVSRSSVVSQILGPALADVARLLTVLPLSPKPEDVLRLRGASEELIRERLAEVGLLGGSDDRSS